MSEAIWQDLEWGSYDVDLALWLELAEGRSAVLDLGCGTGRVAMSLAAAGHTTTGLDAEPALVDELRRRAGDCGLRIVAVTGDIRDFDLGHQFDLVLAPMQLLQLLQGAQERQAALARIRDHLLPGGLFATALLDLSDEAIDSDYLAPLPDIRETEGWVFSSQATAIRTVDQNAAIVLHRQRHVVTPAGQVHDVKSEIRLELLSAGQLELELTRAGLRPLERRPIPATDDYMGSIAVIAERPE
jgi:SAM-dependent methyltransferase